MTNEWCEKWTNRQPLLLAAISTLKSDDCCAAPQWPRKINECRFKIEVFSCFPSLYGLCVFCSHLSPLLSPFLPLALVWCESSHRLKHGVVLSVVGSRHQTRSTNQPGAHVAHDVAIQVGHDHDIELLRPGNQLTHAQIKTIQDIFAYKSLFLQLWIRQQL